MLKNQYQQLVQRTQLRRRIVRAVALGFVALLFLAGTAQAATTSTYLGKVYTGDGGNALHGYLDMPKGLTLLPDGSFLIADTVNNVIRKIDGNGTLSTYSGDGEYGVRDGAKTKAWWSEPEGIANDGKGNVYVADTGSSRIRKISKNAVRTLPVQGLRRPSAVLVRGSTLYISDTGNNRIVSTSTKGGAVAVLADKVKTPLKLARIGNTLYVVEFAKSRILAVNTVKKTKRVLVNGFTEPRAIAAVDGSLYVASGPSGIENELWKVNPKTGKKTLLFRERETEWLNQTVDIAAKTVNGVKRLFLLQNGGSSLFSVKLDGSDLTQHAGRHRFGDEAGNRSQALVGRPKALVATDDGKKIYIAYGQGNKIGVFDTTTGLFSVLAGHLMDNYREETGTSARFSDVSSMVLSPDETTLYLADRNNERIRTLSVTTGTTGYLTGAGYTNLISPKSSSGAIDPDLANGYQEGGPCADTFTLNVKGCAYFNRPTSLAMTSDGSTLYVADASNHRVRSVNVATGETSLIAGSGKKKLQDGVGAAASFNGPSSIALSPDETTLYVADKYNHAVRAITLASGRVSTLAGGRSGYREGKFSKALFSIPETITVGDDGSLYVAEAGGHRIRKLDLAKKKTSLVSGSGSRGKRNGAAHVAEWNGPKGMAFLGDQLLVADFYNDLLRVITLAGSS